MVFSFSYRFLLILVKTEECQVVTVGIQVAELQTVLVRCASGCSESSRGGRNASKSS